MRFALSDHISGLKPLDFEHLVAAAGLSLTLAHPGQAWLGITRWNASASGIDLTGPTLRGSPLYLAGVDSGDAIQQCGQEALKTGSALDACIAQHKPGDILNLLIKGRSGIRTVPVTLAQDPSLQLVSWEHTGKTVPPEISAFRANWLSSKSFVKIP